MKNKFDYNYLIRTLLNLKNVQHLELST